MPAGRPIQRLLQISLVDPKERHESEQHPYSGVGVAGPEHVLDLVANPVRVPTHAVRAASPAGCGTVYGWVPAG
jgi:hypothetical protein